MASGFVETMVFLEKVFYVVAIGGSAAYLGSKYYFKKKFMGKLPDLKKRVEEAHGEISAFYIADDRRSYMVLLEDNSLVLGDVKSDEPGIKFSADEVLGCDISGHYNTEMRQVGNKAQVSNKITSLNLEIRLDHPTSPLIRISFKKAGVEFDKNQDCFVTSVGEVKKYYSLLCNLIQKNYAETTSEAPQTGGAEELEKYFALLNQGAITQEEFDQKKSQLLQMS